jgi:CubicO group peptidase (beta-lactamase class C family)
MFTMNELNYQKGNRMTERISLILCTMLAVCLLVMTAIIPARAEALQGDADFSEIDAYIEAQMEELNIPGLALAIVQGDQMVYMHGYGQADPDGRAVTPQTPFMIGSTGKSITALAVMQLVEAGQIELDAPVQTYLPWFRVADPEASAQITVRHLLNQTSGFSSATGLKEFAASDMSEDAIESSVRRLQDEKLAHPPGATHEYSNVNYITLGLIVQTVSGQPYETYVQEHIFDPLEMRHSFASQAEAVQDGMATGYVTWFRIPIAKDLPFDRSKLPEGRLICSVEDMAHFLLAQINGGRYGDASVLSSEGMAEMHRPAVPTGSTDEFYGMGWFIGPTNDVPTIWHGSDLPNFSGSLLIVPEERLGIVVMMNTNGIFMSQAYRQIATGVMSVLMGRQPQPYQSPEELTKMVGSVVVPAAVSVLWIAWMVYRFIRRRRKGGTPKRSALWVLWVIVLPLAVDIGLLWVLLFGIPLLWGLPMSGLVLMFPDMATLIIGSAIALAGWGLARTVLTLRPVKSRPRSADVPG